MQSSKNLVFRSTSGKFSHCLKQHKRPYSLHAAINSTFENSYRPKISRFVGVKPLHGRCMASTSSTVADSLGQSPTSTKSTSNNESVDQDPNAAIRELVERNLTRSAVALRDICQCSRCVDPSTKQRDFSYEQIPVNISAKSITYEVDHVKIEWENDIPGYSNHISTYSRKNLRSLFHNTPGFTRHHISLWDKAEFEKVKNDVDYKDFMKTDKGLARTLFLIEHYGLVFISNVPQDEKAVKRMANRVGLLRNTFYGKTWDVKSIPQAKNVAYTSKFLGFHMDLLYMREPPGLQLLHTLENTCEGGESLFADTFKAVDTLHSQNPEYTRTLMKNKIRYTYNNDGYFYTDRKPVISSPPKWPLPEVRYGHKTQFVNGIDRVYWSPPFIGSINQKDGKYVPSLLKASKAFSSLLQKPEMIYQTKTEPGTCAIFDNLRVVHARTAFDMNSGKRWLKGAYADIQDAFSHKSRLRDEVMQAGF